VHNVKNLGGALVFISHFVFLDHPSDDMSLILFLFVALITCVYSDIEG